MWLELFALSEDFVVVELLIEVVAPEDEEILLLAISRLGQGGRLGKAEGDILPKFWIPVGNRKEHPSAMLMGVVKVATFEKLTKFRDE